MPDLPTKDLNEFDAVTPVAADNLICGRGRFTVDALITLIAAQLASRTVAQNALKVRINGTSAYGYIVLAADSGGNLSPTYYTEEEYNALS